MPDKKNNGRDEYFKNLYEVWGVGKTDADKITFWTKFKPYRVFCQGTESDVVKIMEEYHLVTTMLPMVEVVNRKLEGDLWPSQSEIFIEKYYWDNGVVSDTAGRLRFFRSNYMAVAEGNKIPDDTEGQLQWFEQAIIEDLYHDFLAKIGELKLA